MEKGILDIVGGGRSTAPAPSISGMESLFRSMASLSKDTPRTNPLHNLPSEASTPVFQIVHEPDSPVRPATPGRSGSLSARAKTIPASPASVPMSPRALDRASPFEGMAQGMMSASSTLTGEKGLLETIPDERVSQDADVPQQCFRPLRPGEADLRSIEELQKTTTGVERVYQSTIRQHWLDDESVQENAEWNVHRWASANTTGAESQVLSAPGYGAPALDVGVSLTSGMSKMPSKTTLGLALDGAVIKGFHPQFDFSTLSVGDRIVKVDGESIDLATLADTLRGTDIVGSVVTLTVRKSDGSCLDMQLRRWGIAGGKDKHKHSVQAPPEVTPRPAMSTLLSTPRGMPPASVQAMRHAFGQRQVDVVNEMVAAIENSAVDAALDKAGLHSLFAPHARKSSLNLDELFKILDLDSDGYISPADLANARFFFGQHEDKLQVLFEFYEDSEDSLGLAGVIKKLVLHTTRSLFKLRSIIHGGGMAKPYLETGPSPAMVLKAVDEVCFLLHRDSSRVASFREFLLEAQRMKLTSSATLKTWQSNMDCLHPSPAFDPFDPGLSLSPGTSASKEMSDVAALTVTPPRNDKAQDDRVPFEEGVTLTTQAGREVVVPTSNKFQGLVAAACNEVGVASIKAGAIMASLQRSQHMTLEWVLEEDVDSTAAAVETRDPPAPSSHLSAWANSVQTKLGLRMTGSTVHAVMPDSMWGGKLKVGDTITRVQRRQTSPATALRDLADAAVPGESILLAVRSNGTESDISLRVPFKSHKALAEDLPKEMRTETHPTVSHKDASKSRGDYHPQIPTGMQALAGGFLSSLTRVNESILKVVAVSLPFSPLFIHFGTPHLATVGRGHQTVL